MASHLQYTDDTIFFRDWSKRNASNIAKLLKCFEDISSLRVNFKKSNLYGVGVIKEAVDDLAKQLDYAAGTLPFVYLEMPIWVKMGKATPWQTILDKFNKRFSEATAKTISFGGRLTMVKSILSSIPLYFFSLFCAPCSIIKSLETLTRTLMEAQHGSISSKWANKWIGNDELQNTFGRLFALVTNKEALVSERITSSITFNSGCWQWVRTPKSRGQAHLNELNRLISSFSLSDINDTWKWSMDSTGHFTTKAITSIIGDKKLMEFASNVETIRNKAFLQKVDIFIWRSIMRKIPPRSELDKRE
ncbi:uncharacterized protein [Rutidosis leptorrhynchoides]|uniref:uncharacterized protein n=1 Tax=Rutidosis leptorrhynchoides TaxID=125765 RepID=UPI003A993EED